jgi:hypothetical protein
MTFSRNQKLEEEVITDKDIKIILRLFLAIDMYCQASSSQM